ncbi:MAG TPA: hypothetical protein VF352_05375 [Anaerolineales bacterium]
MPQPRREHLLIGTVALIVAFACAPFSKIGTPSADTPLSPTRDTSPSADTPAGPVAAGSGGFSAQATSANSVLLTWPAVAGAQKYLLDVQANGGDFLQAVELNADQTSYEDVGVPDAFELTYRVRVQTASGTSAGDVVTITTPAAAPNPLTVQANDYAPVTWTAPTPDPNHPSLDPSTYYPPGYDPAHPENFDPSSLMQPVRASADIGPEGGVLSVTTPDNITYRLTIPPNALEESTPISLIPIETIDGLPLGELQGAVRMEPDGLLLDLPATLTISRADAAAVPVGMIEVGFAFDGSGQEFHLQPFATAAQTGLHPGAPHMASLTAAPLHAGPLSDIALKQLRDYGIAVATPQQAAAVVKRNTPTSAEDRLLNQLAYSQETEPELMPLIWKSTLATQALLKQAQNDAPNWGQMTIALSQLDILMRYYGKDPKLSGDLEKALNLLAARLSTMLKYNLENCLTGDDYYVQAVVGTMLSARPGTPYEALKKKLDPQLLKDIAAMRKKCVLALTINSEIHEDDGLTAKTIVQVAGRIDQLKFHFYNGQVFLTGEGLLHYAHVEIFPYPQGKDHCDPWIPDNLDSITARAIVTRLDLTFARVPGGALQAVTLTHMTITDKGIFTGMVTCHSVHDDGTTEVASVRNRLSAPRGSLSLWYGYFTVAHMKTPTFEFEVDANRPLSGGAEAIIAKFISNQPSFSPGYGTWSENSEFDLVDTGSR